MKHLQLYEGFESNVINKAIKFLKGKNINTKNFENELVNLQKRIDYPLSNIKDRDVKYLNFKQAILVKNDKKVDNNYGIYCIKYWFSLENGYLGSTITGNTIVDKKLKNKPFTKDHFNYIVDKLDIKTGILKPVRNYLDLKTGDRVIGMYSSNANNKNRIDIGIIAKYYDDIYVIQNNSAGSTPTEDGYDHEESWRKYGRLSWSIYHDGIRSNNHHYLHLYIESDDELHYEDDEYEENYLDYNLPNDNFRFREWVENKNIFINDADFAIIIMLDDLLKQNKLRSSISSKRTLSKIGALKLMTDQEVRDFNINKYLQIRISKLINKDTAEFSNLQKLVCKTYCDRYILPSILSIPSSNDSNMNTLMIILLKIAGNVKGDNTSNIKDAVAFFKFIDNHNTIYSKRFKTSLELARTIKNEDIKIIIDMIENMSVKIYNYLQKQNIQTIQDLKIILTKINNIGMFFKSIEFNIRQVDELRYLLSTLYSPMEIQENINYFNNNNSYKKSIESIKIIEKYIDSDFK